MVESPLPIGEAQTFGSLYVFELDYLNVVFESNGTYAREARPYVSGDRSRRPYALECSQSGRYVAVGWEEPGLRIAGFYRAEAPAWILAPVGDSVPEGAEVFPDAGLYVSAELGAVLSSERIGAYNENGAGGSSSHPLGRKATFAITPDAVFGGTGEALEIRRYRFDGSVEQMIRWAGQTQLILREHLEAYRNPEEDVRPELPAEFWERERNALLENPAPPSFPTFNRLEVDPIGNLWAESFPRPGDQGRAWIVFDPRGVHLGEVELPPDIEVTDISEGAILGIARDALGVHRVRLYTLVKPS